MNAPLTRAALSPVKGDGYLLYDYPQGSPEWKLCRAGVITASMFRIARAKVNGLTAQQAIYVKAALEGKPLAEAMVLAGYKAPPKAEVVARALDGEKVGEPSDAAKDYAFRVALERIGQKPIGAEFSTWQMKLGNKLEPFARAAHEDRLSRKGGALEDLLVQTAGFMTTEDGVFGCSVDGLIGNVGGSEYKCLSSPKALRPVLMDDDISTYMDQMQGCMWLTGREWWHFGLYYPALATAGLDFHMIDVQRDEDYIDALEADLLEFAALVNQYEATLRAKGYAYIELATQQVEAQAAAEATADLMAELTGAA